MFSSVPLVPLDNEEEQRIKKARVSKQDPAWTANLLKTIRESTQSLHNDMKSLRNEMRDDMRSVLQAIGIEHEDVAKALPQPQRAQNNPEEKIIPHAKTTLRRRTRIKTPGSVTRSLRSAAAFDIVHMLTPVDKKTFKRTASSNGLTALDEGTNASARALSSQASERVDDADTTVAQTCGGVPSETKSAFDWSPGCGLDVEPTGETEPLVPASKDTCISGGDLRLIDSLRNYAEEQQLEDARARTPYMTCTQDLVASREWEIGVAVLIALNAIWIGVSVEIECRGFPEPLPPNLQFVDIGFCAIFCCELVIRLISCGGILLYLLHPLDMWWNIFDLVVVTLTAADLVTESGVANVVKLGNFSGARAVRLIRIARFIRFMRVVRVLRVVQELRTVLSSAFASLKALLWTLALMFLLIYIVALCLTQLFLEQRRSSGDHDFIEAWWGSLFQTLLTLFACITSGVPWETLVRPMMEQMGPMVALMFVFYIAFSLLAFLNVVTGVFVEKALTKAEQNKVEFLRDRVCDAFRRMHNDSGEGITAEAFERMVNTDEIKDYFRAIDVDTADSRTIFGILDSDKSGTVNTVEFITGCMRLRGPAQALHLELLMHESKQRQDSILALTDRLQQQVQAVIDQFESKQK